MKPLHPAVEAILRFFEYDHLPPQLQEVSQPFHDLAWDMAAKFEGAELTIGLRKLLEAKDCVVRAALPTPQPQGAPMDSSISHDPFAPDVPAPEQPAPVEGLVFSDGSSIPAADPAPVAPSVPADAPPAPAPEGQDLQTGSEPESVPVEVPGEVVTDQPDAGQGPAVNAETGEVTQPGEPLPAIPADASPADATPLEPVGEQPPTEGTVQ